MEEEFSISRPCITCIHFPSSCAASWNSCSEVCPHESSMERYVQVQLERLNQKIAKFCSLLICFVDLDIWNCDRDVKFQTTLDLQL